MPEYSLKPIMSESLWGEALGIIYFFIFKCLAVIWEPQLLLANLRITIHLPPSPKSWYNHLTICHHIWNAQELKEKQINKKECLSSIPQIVWVKWSGVETSSSISQKPPRWFKCAANNENTENRENLWVLVLKEKWLLSLLRILFWIRKQIVYQILVF